MTTLIRREFDVSVSVAVAWEALANVESWPHWATHIRRIDIAPVGTLALGSTGALVLKNGIKSRFVVTELKPMDHWTWVGPFLSLKVSYNHHFTPLGDERCRMTWVVAASGLGVSTLGRLFAAIYKRNMERAIVNLVRHLDSAHATCP